MSINTECSDFECALTEKCIMSPYGKEACKNCYTIKCDICHMKHVCKKQKEYREKIREYFNWWKKEK